ncbi:MAG: DUF4830 domain-containing protein [Oscillospiraceae bacterium]|nr:DUF4830 domain-containing protein [Oscillospiraceae bacterium]
MLIKSIKLSRGSAVFGVVMAALVLVGVLLLAGAAGKRGGALSGGSEEARAEFLQRYGWQAETPALSEESVIIPREFSDVMEQYNDLQLSQGFDLRDYAGTELTVYSYRIEGFDGEEEVIASLYVSGGKIVGGDVHSTVLDGFMVGVTTGKAA